MAEMIPLGEICKTRSGGTPSRTNPGFYGGDIPWVKCGDLRDSIITKTNEYITATGLAQSSAKMLPKGTLLIALYAGATIGRLGILDIEACTNQAICAITPPQDLDTKYLFWYLMSVRDDLQAQGAGGVQLNINQSILCQTKIPMLPLAKQKEVVSRIESLFARLNNVDYLKQKIKEDLNTARIATDKNFLYEKSSSNIKFSDLADINPRMDKSNISDNLQISFVPMSSVNAKNGKIDVSKNRPFSEVKKGYTPFLEGDVLFAKITPCMENGKMAIVPKLKNNYGFGSTEFHVLRPKNGADAEYIYRIVSSQKFRDEATKYMTGSAGQKRVPASYVANYKIPTISPINQRKRSHKIRNLSNCYNNIDTCLRNVDSYVGMAKTVVLSQFFNQ